MTLIQEILIAVMIFSVGGFLLWCIRYGRELDRRAERLAPPRMDCIATGGRDHWEVSEGRVRNP